MKILKLLSLILSWIRELFGGESKREPVVMTKNPSPGPNLSPKSQSKGLCGYCHKDVFEEIPFYTQDTGEPLHDHCASRYLDQGRPVVKGRV